MTALAPASHKPSVQLAAWTVVNQADGNISVTLRDLRDPAGLQSRLRTGGVPASVTFHGQRNPSCRPCPANPARLNKVLPPYLGPGIQNSAVFVINPSALPNGTSVQLAAGFSQHPAPGGANIVIDAPGLVYASSQRTGSS